MSESTGLRLEGLFDAARIARELGISRTAAIRIMQQVPKQKIPGLRKAFVRGEDLVEFLDRNLDAA